MEHKNLREIGDKAQVVPFTQVRMSRTEKLQRWADVLDRHPGRVTALERVEYIPYPDRAKLRGDNSPLAIAYADPVLREEGLTGDTLGEAMNFFELSDREVHRMLCDCHYHGGMSADVVARRLRTLSKGGLGAWFA